MSYRLVGLLVVSVLLPLLGGSVSAASAPALSVIALQPPDLPHGTYIASNGYVTNDDVAKANHISLSTVKRSGRVLGYTARYFRETGRGVDFIAELIAQYNTPRQATAAYGRGVAGDKSFAHLPGYRQLSNPSGGTALVSFNALSPSYRETQDILDSHKGNYYFWIEQHFIQGTVSPHRMALEILHDAQVLRSRMPPAPYRLPKPYQSGATEAPTLTQPAVSPPLQPVSCTFGSSPRTAGSGSQDPSGGAGACVETRDLDGNTNFSGYLGTMGQSPPPGSMYLHAWVLESTMLSDLTYTSSTENFEVQGRDGRTFPAQSGAPYGFGDGVLQPVTLPADTSNTGTSEAGTPKNEGYVEFVVPEHDGLYTVLWNEAGAIPFTPIAALAVYPSH